MYVVYIVDTNAEYDDESVFKCDKTFAVLISSCFAERFFLAGATRTATKSKYDTYIDFNKV